MQKTIRNSAALLLVLTAVLSVLLVPASAKSDKAGKAPKPDKEISSVTGAIAVITLDQAKAIAAAHAGVELDEAVFTREKLDKTVYELKFSTPEGKYEYEISAADGAVLRSEADVKRVPEQSPSYEDAVSPAQARQIALTAAGLGTESVKYVNCYVSWKDHAPFAYEVKFSTRAAYYHYTVDMDSGEILWSSRTAH